MGERSAGESRQAESMVDGELDLAFECCRESGGVMTVSRMGVGQGHLSLCVADVVYLSVNERDRGMQLTGDR